MSVTGPTSPVPPIPLVLLFTMCTSIGGVSYICGIWNSWKFVSTVRPSLNEMFDLKAAPRPQTVRSEEHTSELQSLRHLVCRLLLEKKKKELDQVLLIHIV